MPMTTTTTTTITIITIAAADYSGLCVLPPSS